MKAWLIHKLQGLQHLRLTETPDPSPTADEVILRVDYAALNPADRYLAMNRYPAKPALPHILGRDGVGVVESVGANVTQWRPGEDHASTERHTPAAFFRQCVLSGRVTAGQIVR